MKFGAWMAAAAVAIPSPVSALDLRVSASARGWFFGADGNVRDTDLGALDFDSARGQPEVAGQVEVRSRHRLAFSYLETRRAEEGRARGTVLGVVPVEDTVGIDLEVDYLRGHYGFEVFANEWFDVEPFLEVAWLREATDIQNATTGERRRQADSVVFPLPGAAFGLRPADPLGLVGRLTGVATGRGHLLDVEGGVEARYGFAFAGVGYRHAALRVEDSDSRPVADLRLGGFYIGGGVRF
jgi:hypothetical protein